MTATIGIIGLILLAIGWVPQTYSVIKSKKSKIDWRFGTLYVIGSLCLAFYSFQIKDVLFMILNSVVALMGAISLYYSIKK
ncbi:MAG: hypothetical protein WCX73_03145 [Candidatus Pacearchaeota archaeon]|jgi:uncharacterized protein with PQ loop repeat